MSLAKSYALRMISSGDGLLSLFLMSGLIFTSVGFAVMILLVFDLFIIQRALNADQQQHPEYWKLYNRVPGLVVAPDQEGEKVLQVIAGGLYLMLATLAFRAVGNMPPVWQMSGLAFALTAGLIALRQIMTLAHAEYQGRECSGRPRMLEE